MAARNGNNIGLVDRLLAWLEQFISKYYPRQPPWVRSTVFLVLVGLFVFVAYRVTLGEFSVSGQVLQTAADGTVHAFRNADVAVKDRYFGTNFKGNYYVILSPWEYAQLLTTGSLEVSVSRDDQYYLTKQVPYSRVSQQLERISIPATPVPVASTEEGSGVLGSVLPVAYAATGIPPDRLFVTWVRLKEGAAHAREASLVLKSGSLESGLLSVGFRAAGMVPLAPGSKLTLGSDFFFDLPAGELRPPSAIELNAPYGLWSYSEEFPLSKSLVYGREEELAGKEGSAIGVVRLLPFDVVIWQKTDIASVADALTAGLRGAGFRVTPKASPLGLQAQTNAIFAGPSVTYSALQRVLELAKSKGVVIKKISYKRPNLASHNPYEIQIGGDGDFEKAGPVPEEKLGRLLKASSQEEFEEVLAH